MNENRKLYNESYVLYDRVMNPLAAQQERKPRKDRGTRRGRHSTSSSSSAFDQPSSSHLNDDDDDGNGEGTSRASTPSPIRYVNSLTNQVPQVFQILFGLLDVLCGVYVQYDTIYQDFISHSYLLSFENQIMFLLHFTYASANV
ncbi:hypothetical protein Tco_0815490 [Tanacetum coccineum]